MDLSSSGLPLKWTPTFLSSEIKTIDMNAIEVKTIKVKTIDMNKLTIEIKITETKWRNISFRIIITGVIIMLMSASVTGVPPTMRR